MTVAARPSKKALSTITDLMGTIKFRMYRNAGNTGGSLLVGLGGNPESQPFSAQRFVLSEYATGVWHECEAHFDLTGTGYSGDLSALFSVPYYGWVAGAPFSIADVRVILGKPSQIVWQKTKSGAYTLTTADIGRSIYISTGGVTLTDIDCPVGSMFTIVNNSGSNQTITASGVTLRLAGTATTGSRTLAQYGIANILKLAAGVYSVSGAGVS